MRISGSVGPATVTRLIAPSLESTGGVTLGGQQYEYPTATGRLTGARQSETITPSGNNYAVDVPPASAALLTVGSR